MTDLDWRSACGETPDCTLAMHHKGPCLPVNKPTVLSGEIRPSTVEIPGVKEGLAVGPDDVLVLVIKQNLDVEQMDELRDHLNRILGPNRYVIIASPLVSATKVYYPRESTLDRAEIEGALSRAPLSEM